MLSTLRPLSLLTSPIFSSSRPRPRPRSSSTALIGSVKGAARRARTNLADKKLSAEFNLSVLFLSRSDSLLPPVRVRTHESEREKERERDWCEVSLAGLIGVSIKPRRGVISRELCAPGAEIISEPVPGLPKCINVVARWFSVVFSVWICASPARMANVLHSIKNSGCSSRRGAQCPSQLKSQTANGAAAACQIIIWKVPRQDTVR